MRIRKQLVILVLAVLAPVALLAALASVGLWDIQRDAYRQRIQERVSALRLALDTELEAVLRELRTLSESPVLDAPVPSEDMTATFQRMLRNNPSWGSIGLAAADGAVRYRLDRRTALAGWKPEPQPLAELVKTGTPYISNLVNVGGGVHVTYVAVPVVRASGPDILFIGIEDTVWLDFFRRYPIHERATLTLNDRNAIIIARTLDNERWAGQRSTSAFWDRTVGRTEGSFANVGVDGQRFYSAFSRSRVSSWVVGTGVPQRDVEAALSRPTMAIVLGVLAAAGFASIAALVLGGRIIGALSALANAVESVTSGQASLPQAKLPIDEAETVRLALVASHEQLAAREASLNEALGLEAKSRAAAERASQAKDDLLAMLGHELRNPLSAIKTAVTIVEMPNATPEMATRAREVVKRQIGHLTTIIDELLDVARLTSGKTQLKSEPLDLAEVARHVLDAFNSAGRCSQLQVETRLAAARVYGDETRLEQVVSNLLDNACKYTPSGGRIALSVAIEDATAVLMVADSGSGISRDLLPHIFELFSQGSRTLDRSQGGLGLGLTVVRRLVELHGGTVEAASEGADRGASFIVRLPLLQAQPRAQSLEAMPPELPPLDVVVVEDNADNREVVVDLLRTHGHRVVSVDDGVRGVEAILGGRYDVALVDIGLPGCDGYEVARRVRAAPGGGAVLLVALTGYGRDEDRTRATAAGFDAFLVKPFDIARFERALGESTRNGAVAFSPRAPRAAGG
ncbi:MAG: response regulator [Betaproteobacteria bacterium]|nr:response regulator [Betaproteobacteria bacterium]